MSTTQEISFGVIICAHDMNRVDLLRASIRSVLAQNLPAGDIVVVCDHNPALLAVVGTEFPDVAVVANQQAQGLSGARNTGISIVKGGVVAFIDDDATAEADWLSILAKAYADPAIMAVGGGILPLWPANRPRWMPPEFDWTVGCSYVGLPTQNTYVRNLIGCNMSMRRNCLDAVGGFASALGRVGDNASGCEETEVFIRMQTRFPDRSILFVPAARVHHSISANRMRWRYFANRCRAEGRAKAMMTQTVGLQNSLSTEASYVRKVLPAGVLRGITDATKGDMAGLARSGVIVAGLAMTTAAFALQRAKMALNTRPLPEPFKPRLIVDADLSKGLPELSQVSADTAEPYGAAWCLIRDKGQPVKLFELPFDAPTITARDLEARVRSDTTPLPDAPIPQVTGAGAPHVTVVVATRNRATSLARCLDSLMAQTYPSMDIVVVDNAPSSSETRDLIASTYAPTGQVRYVLEQTPGLGRAHNTGVTAARGSIIAFTDDDVIADPAWVAAIAANFTYDDQIGCVTGLILPAELETRAQYWTERHGGFGKGLSRKVFDPKTGHRDNPLFPYAAGAFGSGANMAFRRETLERMGGFDPALGAGTLARGGDDLASLVSALQSGYRIAYEPGAIVWHHHRRSQDGMRRQAYNYGVGLGAYLTKQVVEDPRRLAFFARKSVAAFRHLFSPNSSKMDKLPDDYPRQYVWSERLGILMGVPGYLRSRRQTRRVVTHLPMTEATDPI